MRAWIEVRASFKEQPPDRAPFADAFQRFGCPSSIDTDCPPATTGYLPDVEGADQKADALKKELLALGADSVEIGKTPDEDWSGLWKIHFKPRRVGKRFIIRPTWEAYNAAEDDLVIVLDPGQAFGTGDHQTTRLCLELLEAIDVAGKSVADIGCGSGVLAIAAAMLGAKSVLAADIDPLSVEVAKGNFSLNHARCESVFGDGFDVLDGPRDIVISNIISATLIRLAPDATRAVKNGGLWVVSGIIEANWPDVLAAATRCGFCLERRIAEDEWVGASFRRSA